MIVVVMKKDANLPTIETVMQSLRGKRCDVQMRDPLVHGAIPDKLIDGSVVLVATGEGGSNIDPLFVRELPGVAGILMDNGLFHDRHQEFVEPWQFFAKRDRQTRPDGEAD